MSRLEQALKLASQGFWLFPLIEGGKNPAIKGWPDKATRDEDKLRRWFASGDRNIGIYTGRFCDDAALVAVDVDNKNGKNGDEQILRLELEGLELPPTAEQRTPTGGRHLLYRVGAPLKQGVEVLGPGLDIRSRGGFVVGAGSAIGDAAYSINAAPVVEAPQWLVDRLGADTRERTVDRSPVAGVDPGRAHRRATDYLATAPASVKGQSGDVTAYKVAAKLKDLGCTEAQALDLMLSEHWHNGCGWAPEKLAAKVAHAFKYGQEAPGIDAPEAVFSAAPAPEADEGEHPFDKMNREFAFVKRGAFVLQETTDEKGRYVTEHLNMTEFHAWFANKPFQAGNAKPRPISEWWLEWTSRRQYEGVVFMPAQDAGPRWYNMWRGFAIEPAATADHPAVAAFREHALKNVCNGDEKLCRWLLGYFAHMVQKPWEKPLVALVFRGKKGTGKNALVERVGHLLGTHFMLADDDRYLLSNFNAHMESCLFMVLDEASWAGDKRAEGRLKGLITGKQHNIERKGKETYRVDNLLRVAILGNEDWLVPASQDERRFAVFTVGEGRMQDRKFFHAMRVGMENGGYAHLLRFLLDYDMTGIDVNDAPKTAGLVQQKHESLTPVEEWWLDSLMAGEIQGADFGGEWPKHIATNRLRAAFERWSKARNVRGRLPTDIAFGRTMKKIAPSFSKLKQRPDNAGDASYAFFTPGIDELRANWEKYIGGAVQWEDQ